MLLRFCRVGLAGEDLGFFPLVLVSKGLEEPGPPRRSTWGGLSSLTISTYGDSAGSATPAGRRMMTARRAQLRRWARLIDLDSSRYGAYTWSVN